MQKHVHRQNRNVPELRSPLRYGTDLPCLLGSWVPSVQGVYARTEEGCVQPESASPCVSLFPPPAASSTPSPIPTSALPAEKALEAHTPCLCSRGDSHLDLEAPPKPSLGRSHPAEGSSWVRELHGCTNTWELFFHLVSVILFLKRASWCSSGCSGLTL